MSRSSVSLRSAAVALIVTGALVGRVSPAFGASVEPLTSAQRCDKLVALGVAGRAAYDEWRAASSKTQKAHVLEAFYQKYLGVIRMLAASPPAPIADELRSLRRWYEAHQHDARFPKTDGAGKRIAKYVQATCIAPEVAVGTLTASDLPGWVTSPDAPNPSAKGNPIPKTHQCDVLRELQSHTLGYGSSTQLFPEAVGDGNSYITNSVSVYPSPAFAERVLRDRVSAPFRACIREGGIDSIKARLPTANVTRSVRLVKVGRVGDDSGLLVTTTHVADQQNGDVTFYSQDRFVRIGRTVVALQVATEGRLVWTALREHLSRLLAHRLRAASSDSTA